MGFFGLGSRGKAQASAPELAKWVLWILGASPTAFVDAERQLAKPLGTLRGCRTLVAIVPHAELADQILCVPLMRLNTRMQDISTTSTRKQGCFLIRERERERERQRERERERETVF